MSYLYFSAQNWALSTRTAEACAGLPAMTPPRPPFCPMIRTLDAWLVWSETQAPLIDRWQVYRRRLTHAQT